MRRCSGQQAHRTLGQNSMQPMKTQSVSKLINSPDADIFTASETDNSTLVPVFDRRSFFDDICFGGQTFDDCLATLDKLRSRFEECRISVGFTKSILHNHEWNSCPTISHGTVCEPIQRC
ncbi:unnamed protein product [Phytophthora fragariaefolia]|uniref:Unnamed protein product n=1 Tax=Phytophthora fragariaefolia TaxID=1490495 RepID=A0A9W6UD67_9STRA|nr:unnamed protein product [Phytophthora fragariaefolia]